MADLILREHGHTQLCQNLPLSTGENWVIDRAVHWWNLVEEYELNPICNERGLAGVFLFFLV